MKKNLLLIILALFYTLCLSAQTGPWVKKADYGPGPRQAASSFAINGKIYVGIGLDVNSASVKDFWEYDPATNVWTRKADFPGTARNSGIGFSIGSKGYIGTGFDGTTYYKDFYEYDPATDKWTRKADFGGQERRFATAFSIGSKGYIGCGSTFYPNEIFHSDFWEYDQAADTWTRKADYGGGQRSNPRGFSIGNKGYIGTGYLGGWHKDFWEYDPATNVWTRKADFGGAAREWAAAFSVANKGYLGTGYNFSYFKDFWEYNPASNSWTKITDFAGDARNNAVGVSDGTTGYVGLGFSNVAGVEKDFYAFYTTCQAPAVLKIISVTDSSAKLGWTVPGSTIGGFMLRYAPAGSSQVKERMATATSTQITLKNLAPNTTYRWRMRSVCSNALSEWVSGPAFTTNASGTFANNITVTPNPVSGGVLRIHVTSIEPGNIHITISDIQGRLFIQQTVTSAGNSLDKVLDITQLPKGMYVLKIADNAKNMQINFVKNN